MIYFGSQDFLTFIYFHININMIFTKVNLTYIIKPIENLL